MGILRGGGVEVFIDRNKADITDAEILFDVVAGVDGVPPQTGEVFLCQVGTKKIFENLQAVHRRTTTRERLACKLNS